MTHPIPLYLHKHYLWCMRGMQTLIPYVAKVVQLSPAQRLPRIFLISHHHHHITTSSHHHLSTHLISSLGHLVETCGGIWCFGVVPSAYLAFRHFAFFDFDHRQPLPISPSLLSSFSSLSSFISPHVGRLMISLYNSPLYSICSSRLPSR